MNQSEITKPLGNIVLGIGCRRGTDTETIEKNISGWLSDEKIPFENVKTVATIDIKKDEKGLVGFCEKYGFEMIVFSAEQLMQADGKFTASEFVRKTTGTDNVCERSAFLASGGKLIMKKHAGDGVTCAAAETVFSEEKERGKP